jgi:transposase-like protein
MATCSLCSSAAASAAPEGVDWRAFNHRALVMRTLNESDARQFAAELGLLPSQPVPYLNCGASAASMRLAKNGDLFRCRECQASFSVRRNAYFEGSHLTTSQVLEHLYFSCTHINQVELMHECNIGSWTTIARWFSGLRAIPSLFFANQSNNKIGGSGHIVEMDESHLMTRKFNRGRVLVSEQLWVVGEIDRTTGQCFVVEVTNRNKATLERIIVDRIEPGSIIFTDCWRGYSGIGDLPQGYQHGTVNHFYEFEDEEFRFLHTQNIEALWGSLKRDLPRHLTDELRGDYFIQYMYWRKYDFKNMPTGLKFKTYCDHIAQCFPGPFRQDIAFPEATPY